MKRREQKEDSCTVNANFIWLTSVLDKQGLSSSQQRMFVQMQTGLFVLMAVSNEPCNQMDNKVDGTTMTRMLDLRACS